MNENKEIDNIRDDKLRIGLKGLKRLYEANAKNMTKDEIMAFDITFINIANALTELQQIKSASPTKALECLESLENWLEDNDMLCDDEINEINTIKQALQQAVNVLGVRRNCKTLEQMYQLVQYSRPPMKPAVWVAKIDGNLEQRVVMEKKEYDKLKQPSKKEQAFDVVVKKMVDIIHFKYTLQQQIKYPSKIAIENYNRHQPPENKLTQEEFELLKEMV